MRRIFLYSLIAIFLITDYISFTSGVTLLEDIGRSGLLKYIFPTLFILIISLTVLSVRGKLYRIGFKREIFSLAVIVAATVIFFRIGYPQGKVHFLEYAILTLLFFKALEIDIKGKAVYYVTLICLIFVAVIEEIAQSLYPDRTFDLRDLKLDMAATVLMLALIAVNIRRKST